MPDTKCHTVFDPIYRKCPDKSIETESRLVAGGEGKMEVTANVYGVSFWGHENVLELELDRMGGCTTL